MAKTHGDSEGDDEPALTAPSATTKVDSVEINEKKMVAPKGYEIHQLPDKVAPKETEEYWESFFVQKRGEACNGRKIIRYELQKLGISPDGHPTRAGIPGKGAFGWIKQWGYGDVAYLFDFFDPILRPLILEDFNNIWKKFKAYEVGDSAKYKDPFDFSKEIPANLDPVSKKRITQQISDFKANLDTTIHKLSVNANQVHAGMIEHKWYMDQTVADNAKDFIKRFDVNKDGRLSPRELILGSIFHNKGLLGSDECKMCYEDLTDKIDGIFAYIDCDQDGLISAEDMWEHLPKLRRDTTKWNFFTLAKLANIRTSVVNDFILKNMTTLNGRLNKNEFRLGVLLGFWDRQTDDYKIVQDDSINLKPLRWSEYEVVDTSAMAYIKNKILAASQAELAERHKRASDYRNSHGDKIEIDFAEGSDPNGHVRP